MADEITFGSKPDSTFDVTGRGTSGGSGGGDVVVLTSTETGIAESFNDLTQILSKGKIAVYTITQDDPDIYPKFMAYLTGLRIQDDGNITLYNAVFIIVSIDEGIIPLTMFAEDPDAPMLSD